MDKIKNAMDALPQTEGLFAVPAILDLVLVSIHHFRPDPRTWRPVDFRRPWNALLLVHQGAVRVRRRGEHFTLGPGSATLFPKEYVCSHSCAPETRTSSVRFFAPAGAGGDAFESLPGALDLTERYEAWNRAVSDPAGPLRRELSVRSLLYGLLAEKLPGEAPEWIARMRYDEFFRQLDASGSSCAIAETARRLGLAPTALAYQFRKDFGMPMGRYLTRRAVRRAAALLLSTPLSVREIARRVGYEDALYFSRLFRKVEGCAPLEYRRRGDPGT